MRVLDWFRWFVGPWTRKPCSCGIAIADLARSAAVATENLQDIVRQTGEMRGQHAAVHSVLEKQIADLRNIVTNLGDQAKQRPAVARTMADLRRFTGDENV